MRRNALTTTLLFLVFAASATAPASGQCAYSFPNPVQDAIDAAAPGDVVSIAGLSNHQQLVCIDKPLTLVGPATLTGQEYAPYGVLNVQPGVDGTVLLRDLTITALDAPFSVNVGLGGVYSASPTATLVLEGCTVHGADHGLQNAGGGPGGPGIRGVVELLVVLDSQIEGGDAEPYSVGPGGDGGHAIGVQGTTVLLRSGCQGGDAGDSTGYPSGAPPGFCSLYLPGRPGDAAAPAPADIWESSGSPGQPADMLDCQGGVVQSGPSGQGFGPGAPVDLLLGNSAGVSGSGSPGDVFRLSLQGGASFCAMGVSRTGWHAPIPFGTANLYAGIAFLPIHQGPWPAGGLDLPVPRLPGLVGDVWVIQGVADGRVLNPVQVVVLPGDPDGALAVQRRPRHSH